MKEIKLEEGQVWQKKGTLDVRTIHGIGRSFIAYTDIGRTEKTMKIKSFRQWIRRNKGSKNEVKLIGHYDFKTGKVRAVR